MEEYGIYADKLYTAVSNFNLLTPEYTKFIGAFQPLLIIYLTTKPQMRLL